MKKKTLFFFGIIVIVSVTTSIVWWQSNALLEIPNISLNSIDGRQVEFNALRGKPVLVTFWATSCSTCIKEVPHLIKLYKDLNKKGLEIISIAMPYDPPNRVVTFSENNNIPYTIALDIEGKAIKAFGNVIATPTNFLFGPNGKIIYKKTGIVDFNDLRKQIETLLTNTTSTIS